MKHIKTYEEIAGKLTQMCDEALKEAGMALAPAVSALAQALTAIVSYKSPEVPAPVESPVEAE